jgi:transcriptional regulator with XRE-family HTH domain
MPKLKGKSALLVDKSEKALVCRAFGATVLSFRRRRGLSQVELAASGLSRGHVSEMECGRRNPTLTMLFHLAGVFGVEPTLLMREIWRRYEDLRSRKDS